MDALRCAGTHPGRPRGRRRALRQLLHRRAPLLHAHGQAALRGRRAPDARGRRARGDARRAERPQPEGAPGSRRARHAGAGERSKLQARERPGRRARDQTDRERGAVRRAPPPLDPGRRGGALAQGARARRHPRRRRLRSLLVREPCLEGRRALTSERESGGREGAREEVRHRRRRDRALPGGRGERVPLARGGAVSGRVRPGAPSGRQGD